MGGRAKNPALLNEPIHGISDVYKRQAQGFDPVQLYEARQAIRPGKEQEAENQAQQVYVEKYSPLLMFDLSLIHI